MRLSRELLLKIEEKNDFIKPIFPDVEGYRDIEINYHLKLLNEAGLIEIKLSNTLAEGPKYYAKTLTNEGHEFIASLRQPDVWETICKKFKEESINTLKTVAKDLAKGYAKKKVSELLASENL